MLKRLYFFLSIFLIIGLVLGIGWFVRYRNSVSKNLENIPPANNLPDLSGINPRSGSSASTTPVKVSLPPQKPFGPVADQEVIAYHPYSDGSIIIIQPGGQIMKVVGNEGTVLSSLGISNLSHAAFSYDGKKIVALFGNPLNPQVSVFDTDRKSWEPVFARPASPPLWSPHNYRLLFLTETEGLRTVTTVDMGATTPKTEDLISLNAEDIVVAWKGMSEIFIGEKPSAFSSGQLLAYDIQKKTISTVLKDWPGLDFLWNLNPQEGVVLQSNKNAAGGKMSLVGGTGIIARQFSFVSIPSKKCVFEKPAPKTPVTTSTTGTDLLEQPSRLLICAVPQNANRFLGFFLPDDYFQKEIMTEDYIIQADLSTGNIKNISASVTDSFDGTFLKTTAEAVFFINRYNNKLYRLLRS
ncbi:MAG: hypothetical protein AAB903_03250 [Patescibacteria group bacterium]